MLRGVRRRFPSKGDHEKQPFSTKHFQKWRQPLQHILDHMCSFRKFHTATDPRDPIVISEIAQIKLELARKVGNCWLDELLTHVAVLETMTAALVPTNPISELRALRSDIFRVDTSGALRSLPILIHSSPTLSSSVGLMA